MKPKPLAATIRALLGSTAILATSALAVEKNPDRQVFFGQTHSHTSWSVDAYLIGNHLTTPEDAYKYSMGLPIKHPAGFDVQIRGRPLDFQGVTDHSEYAGVISMANDPNNPLSKTAVGKRLQAKTPAEFNAVFQWIAGSLAKHEPIKELVSPEIAGTVWQKTIEIADKYYNPGKFTTFVAYEWTSAPNFRNMHRNVFFRDSKHVPALPFTAIDSLKPEDLWVWMDDQRKKGNELLAISHNANLSDGLMFPIDVDDRGRPIDAAWAASRNRNERLIEIKQIKGQSETHPLLSPTDEFANYEVLSYLLGDPQGRIPRFPGSYVRQALKDGITMQDTKGFNPFKFGFGAASDSHNTAVPYRQNNFFGQAGVADGTAKQRLSGVLFAGMDPRIVGPAGLTGAWAEENTRASIFDAMQRKETFAVSGPHIKVRLFGGWEYAADTLNGADWVKTGYAKGVPMGGDLPPIKGKAPTFVLWAVKDPTSGNLDRIQIVKGWTKSGQSFEKIFDVAWAGNRKPDKWTGIVPPIGSTVDVENATYTNTIGSVELKTVWTDPEFEPSANAFYYARVLEIPTPRWTTIQAKELGVAPPDVVAATVQERAWTSPIWYTPSPEQRKGAKAGTTVADLKSKGAVALNDAQLQALLVEKSPWLMNTVTGDKYQIIYSASGKSASGKSADPLQPGYITQQFAANQGQLQLRYVGNQAALPSLTGNVAAASYLANASPYFINDGRLVTTLAGTPIEIAVYKVGDKYIGARSNEFGYANYEIIPTVTELKPFL